MEYDGGGLVAFDLLAGGLSSSSVVVLPFLVAAIDLAFVDLEVVDMMLLLFKLSSLLLLSSSDESSSDERGLDIRLIVKLYNKINTYLC